MRRRKGEGEEGEEGEGEGGRTGDRIEEEEYMRDEAVEQVRAKGEAAGARQ
jgi:hypothetical protein